MPAPFAPLRRVCTIAAGDVDCRVETILACTRPCVVVSSWILSHPYRPSSVPELIDGPFAIYLLLSLGALLLLSRRRKVTLAEQGLIHAVDIAGPTFVLSSAQPTESAFLLMLLFASCAAASRWGFPQAVGTVSGVFALSTTLAAASGVHAAPEANHFLESSTVAALAAGLVAYFSHLPHQIEAAASSSVARIIGRASAASGVRETLRIAADELIQLLEARSLTLVVEEIRTGRIFRWEARRIDEQVVLDCSELGPAQASVYRFPGSLPAWLAVRPRFGSTASPQIVGLDGRRIWQHGLTVPSDVLKTRFRALFGARIALGDDWKGCVFLFTKRTAGASELRAFHASVSQLAQAVYSLHLVRGVTSRARTLERARVAREIHDGMIQSVLALEMRTAALRRKTDATDPVAGELGVIQWLLHQEVLRLRDLMVELTPLEFAPAQLVDVLGDWIDRFQRETGIAASFAADADGFDLPPRSCQEVIRIVQEALINVRKHSDARHVAVALRRSDGCYALVVDDDGRGFDFEGRLGQAELHSVCRGPTVIQDRVRALGATLTIDSQPGRGARLEILFPSRMSDHATATNRR
jgi:signal transduction histidine kinase